MYIVELHKSAMGMNIQIHPHFAGDYDHAKRIYDMVSPGNKIFVYIRKII
jgi:hypothetical protein